MRQIGLALTLLWASAALADTTAPLEARQAEATKQQEQLRARIGALQKEIDRHETSRQDAANRLKASESAISDINRRLDELDRQQEVAQKDLERLEHETAGQKKVLAKLQAELAEQLRAQYASGLSPWTALLSGDDPQAIGRDLAYLSYISQAQADAVRAVSAALERLQVLQTETQARRTELSEVARETTTQKQTLEKQKQERQQVLGEINTLLAQQRSQAETFRRDDERLGRLITGLEAAIAKHAEEARLAEEKRKADEARKAEQARQAALAQRREFERQREAARQAQQQAQEEQARAERDRDAERVREARLQVERARAQIREAERAEQAPVPVQPAPTRPPEPVTSAGLSKGLPHPVRGTVQGRFGVERPDGGLWRGIVIRAGEGTQVEAVAAGSVVYADWLKGFGNIIIVDHGAGYLSIYAYNQSLLRSVGDTVAAREAIATVGSTGGQVESGLYFEIRHNGAPVNPLIFLAP